MAILIEGMEMPTDKEGSKVVVISPYGKAFCSNKEYIAYEIPTLWERMTAYAEAFGKNISEEDYRKFETALCETVCREDVDG